LKEAPEADDDEQSVNTAMMLLLKELSTGLVLTREVNRTMVRLRFNPQFTQRPSLQLALTVH
jgi:hypothetical protein